MIIDKNNVKVSQKLRENFETIRLQRRMTLQEISDKSGLSLSFLKKYKASQRGITVDNAAKLAGAFDMTLVGLINWRK